MGGTLATVGCCRRRAWPIKAVQKTKYLKIKSYCGCTREYHKLNEKLKLLLNAERLTYTVTSLIYFFIKLIFSSHIFLQK